jgi:hypothetical protein
MQAYAQHWQVIDTKLRQSTGPAMVLFDTRAELAAGDLVLFTEDSQHWSNLCVAYYYRVGGIGVR